MGTREHVVRVGDTVTRRPISVGEGKFLCTGVVVYIHPEGRYHTVRFDVGDFGGSFRESFFGLAREPNVPFSQDNREVNAVLASKRAVEGAKLRKARRSKGMTISQLSLLTGIPTSTISCWESGTYFAPEPRRREVFAALGVAGDEA